MIWYSNGYGSQNNCDATENNVANGARVPLRLLRYTEESLGWGSGRGGAMSSGIGARDGDVFG